MHVGWMYHDPTNSDYLNMLIKRSGFSDSLLLEKLVLDFETHYYLKDKFEMVVRGGMAALLHAGPTMWRISDDIDVMTSVPQSRIASVLDALDTNDETPSIKIIKGGTRLPNHLLLCEIRCPSSLSQDYCTAQMDILCGVDPSLLQHSKKMRSPRLATLNLHDIDVVSRGALIADKMCALASAETVGLRSLKNFPKHVHDIAMLLRGANADDLQVLFRAYGHFASSTLHMHRQAHSPRDLMDSAHDRSVRLLDFGDSTLLSTEYQEHYARFQSRYVNRKTHTETDHTDEILLALLCARHLRECDADGNAATHSKELHGAIRSYAQAKKAGNPPGPDPGALARIGRAHPNLAGLRAPLTRAQWTLLLEAFAPLLG